MMAEEVEEAVRDGGRSRDVDGEDAVDDLKERTAEESSVRVSPAPLSI